MRFMVSKIRNESGLKNLIDELKNQNENNKLKKEYNIYIDFEQSNSKKMKFISNFIFNNFKDDKYNYIFIIHINRNFNKNKNERIYSLPDINPEIDQLFIDNLNGNNKMTLTDLLKKDIIKILEENKDELKLKEEFNKILINTLTKELNEKGFENNIIDTYISEIENYMKEEDIIKDKIIEITYKFIDNNNDEEKKCKDIINKIYKENYINQYDIDITSCIIKYIKENIFNTYLKKIFLILEDNNIFTTILDLKKNGYKVLTQNLVEEIVTKYLDEITIEKNEIYKPKFLYNYNIPGFYNFYINISDYINKNITPNYFSNEKKIRELLKADVDKIREFHEKEESLLNDVNKYIANNKFIMDIVNKISMDLIFEDYITYYLQKYRNKDDFYNKDDIYHKLIELLLKLRYNEENEIIKNNDKINILIIKIIWIESNVNYIINIFKIFESAIPIFNNSNTLFNKIEDLILKENEIKINYIINEMKNPEHTKEVNECYYLLLASICYSITSDEIELKELNNKGDNEIEVTHYLSILIDINKILQNLNNDLYIYLNEMYIIDELIKIIELFTKKNNIKKINEIKNLMRENAYIIQKNDNNKDKLSEELIKNFETIYDLIIKDEVIEKNDKDYYYDKIRYIIFKEIKKIPDINYRYKIFEKLLESDEMIKKSNDIFQILLKNYVKKDKYKDNRNNILSSEEYIVKLIDNKLKNNFVLSETLLYFFEKNSLNYLNNIIGTKKEIVKENKKKESIIISLEDEPLDILKDCIEVLNFYIFEPNKLKS